MGRKGERKAAAAILTCALVLLSGACGGQAKPSATKPVTTSTVPAKTSAPSTTTTTKVHHKHKPHKHKAHKVAVAKKSHHKAHRALHPNTICPLTGVRAPGGHVPRRPALAVKVENLPEARPQWGLDKADIVFEEPVEGGITRFIAVFQCHNAPRIEPVRSARLVDPQILEPLGHILFGYSGGIQPAVNEIDSRRSLLGDVGAYDAGNAYWRDPDRYEPHNLVTSTAALYSAAAALHYREKGPTPIFSYGRPVKGGTPAGIVNIDFELDVTTWTWRPRAGVYYRSYSDTGPALQGDGVQISASNVVVMFVHLRPTPWPEDATGTLENELTLKGTGPAWVFRDGRQYYGFWRRPKLDDPTVFYEKKNGFKVRLSPGNTWVELVPYGLKVGVKP